MDKNFHEYRKSYEKGSLTQASVAQNPMHQFDVWFQEAEDSLTVDEVNAMTLSTVDQDGLPKGRIVLLKEVNSLGFIFYTNYNSHKGKAIAANNKVSLSFFWPGMERQIIIQGIASKISEKQSTSYFNKRPRESQFGALVSEQSQHIKDRVVLDTRLQELKKLYQDKPVPKPENWGGYLIKPITFEFWQGRQNRLHDRMYYTLQHKKWQINRLQP